MTSTSARHPDACTLLSFAAGSLSEALAAVVASHASQCSKCRSELADLALVGAALLTLAEPREESVLTALPIRPDDAQLEAGRVHAASMAMPRSSSNRLPAPLAQKYGLSFETIPWKRLGPGVWHYRLPLSAGVDGDLRLLKIGPGRMMPDHGHGGDELTLVLDGTYRDVTGRYGPGDVQDVDESVDHAPVADEKTGCVCLIASERPARFNSLVGKLMQRWTGM